MAIIFGTIPTPAQLAAFEAGSVQVERWMDIYQADNVTLWQSQVPLVDGSVSVDMTRDERRNLDIQIHDQDGAIGYGPGYLWYDKVFKPYRGITLPDTLAPGYLFLPGTTGNTTSAARSALGSATIVEFAVRVTLDAVGVAQTLAGWHASGQGLALTSGNLLNIAVAKTVSGVIGGANSSVAVPGIAAGTKIWLRGIVTIATAVCQYYYSLTDTNDYDQVVWTQVGTNQTGSNAAGAVDLTKSVSPIFGSTSNTAAGFAGKLHAGVEAISGVKTIEFDLANQTTDASGFIATTSQSFGINTSGTYPMVARIVGQQTVPGDTYVVQLGEFLADGIDRPRFPHTIHITGRDFTKKMMLAKFAATTAFAAGANVGTTIQTIATNAGITKFNFVTVTNTLGATVTFEKNSPRWDACKQLAQSISCDLYFDNNGYLTMKPMVDPLTAPVSYTFDTGASGNLADYSRSTNDSRLYNDVLVYGDAPDNPLIYAHVSNTAPSSPTSIANLNQTRTYAFASQFFTSNAQALTYANKLLSVVALEQYDMNLTSIVIPWLEAGTAVEVIAPDAAVSDPTRFLLTSFDIPMMLGTMTALAKRVTLVG
jgi:hypothetical protein